MNEEVREFVNILQGEAKKSVISGILADFGNFFNPSWLPILLKIVLFLGFFYFSKGIKKKILDFLEIRDNYNKKGANYKLMAKFKFLLNSNGYFSKKGQKSASPFSRFFFNISESA